MRPSIRSAAVLILGCLVSDAVAAEGVPKVRTDLYGSALPRGAVSRLGRPRAAPVLSTDDFSTFSPDGKQFISRRQLWDVPTGRLVFELKGPGHPGHLLFTPQGQPMVVTFAEKRLAANSLGVEPFGWEVTTEAAAISPSTGLVTYQTRPGDDGLAKFSTVLRNIWTGLDVHRLGNEGVGAAGRAPEPRRMGVSGDGRQLAALTHTSQIEHHLIGQENRRTSDVLPGIPQHHQTDLLFSPDGMHVAALPERRRGRIEVLSTGRLESTAALRDVVPLGYDNSKVGLAFLADPPQLAVLRGGESYHEPAILKVWNVATEGMTAKMWIRDNHELRRAVLWLAARGLGGELPSGFVPLAEADRKMPALQCRLSSGHLNATAAISRSGELVAVGDDFSVAVWETASGQLVERVQPHSETIRRLVFSPDDRLLLVHCDDGTGLVFETTGAADELRDRPTKMLCEDLAGENAITARKAVLELVRRGDESLPELGADLPRTRQPQEIRRWIAELDGVDKEASDAAQANLRTLGRLALGPLQEKIRGAPSNEQIVRIRALLEHPVETVVDPAVLRGIREIQVAAMIGSEPATAWLKRIAEGNYDPRLTSRAAVAVKRLTLKRL